MRLPTGIARSLSAVMDGALVGDAVPIGGGMISLAARVETNAGPVFVKWREGDGDSNETPGMFAIEADGLRALRAAAAGAVRIPDVIAVDERYLALEFLRVSPVRDPGAFTRRFADGLATLHRATQNAEPFGFTRDGYIGSLPQPNLPRTDDWAVFYRDSRLLPQIAMARANGLLPPDRERLLAAILDRLPDLLAGMPPEPSLLHGDLWSGNFLCTTGDTPALVDPAAYYGPREMEIAYIELFGGFPPGFVAAYDDAFPLDPGYARRRSLHQLYPLINHLNHFGEQYGPAVERVCREYL